MRNENYTVVSDLAQVLDVNRKVLSLALLMFLSASTAAAQTISSQPDAPGIVVIKKSWHREVRNRALDEDPLRVAEQLGQLQRAQKEAIQENVLRAQANQPPIPIPHGVARDPRVGALPDRLPVGYSRPGAGYTYEVKIRNTGPKTIRGIVWEYLLFDPDTQRELGRHLFTSKKSIRPGKSKTLVGRTTHRPAPIIHVVRVGNSAPPHYSEQVVIQGITYDDGSVWKRTSK